MNEEIKEILYYWEKYNFEDCMIDSKEIKILYNYITNLQEENERLNLHIMAIKEAISTWNLEYEEGKTDFKIPKKIKDIVWGDKE